MRTRERGYIFLATAIALGLLGILLLSINEAISYSALSVLRYQGVKKAELNSLFNIDLNSHEPFSCLFSIQDLVTRNICVENLKEGVTPPPITETHCESSQSQQTNRSTRGKQLTYGSLISPQTCSSINTITYFGENLSLDYLEIEDSSEALGSSGFIEISKLVVDGKSLLLAGGDIFINEIRCVANCELSLLSKKGSIEVGEVLGLITIRAKADSLVSLPHSFLSSLGPELPKRLPKIIFSVASN